MLRLAINCPGSPGRPAGVVHLELHRLGPEGVPLHGDTVQISHPLHHVQKLRLIYRQIGDTQAEPLGQRGLLRDGLSAIYLVPGTVGEGLPYQVAAVGGGVYRHIGRTALQPPSRMVLRTE